MGFFHPRVHGPSVPELAKKRAEADDQLKKSEESLKEVKSLTEDLISIRKDNHFAQDWRKALGVKDGR